MILPPPRSTPFPYTTLFRSHAFKGESAGKYSPAVDLAVGPFAEGDLRLKDGYDELFLDRKSTRLNSSHVAISYAVFCLKKKKHAHASIAPITEQVRRSAAAS